MLHGVALRGFELNASTPFRGDSARAKMVWRGSPRLPPAAAARQVQVRWVLERAMLFGFRLLPPAAPLHADDAAAGVVRSLIG